MRRTLKAGLATFALLLTLSIGFLVRGYLPVERSAVPSDDLPGRLLAGAGDFEAALWLPYPHQNLGALAGAVPDPAAWLAAAARLAEVPPPSWPEFGPFAVPPARELAVAAGDEGERALLAARIYPGLARVARLAGTVASNPWLSGGRVEVAGELARVTWEGSLWTVARGGVGPLDGEGVVEGMEGAALGGLHLARPRGLLPAGTYLLRRPAGAREDLELVPAARREPRGSDPAAAWEGGETLLAEGVSLALVNASPSLLEGRRGVLLVFAGDGDPELPEAAVLSTRGGSEGERLRLPQERLPEILRGQLAGGAAGNLAIVASGQEALATARRLAPGAASLLADGGEPTLLWIRPEPLLALVSRGVELVETLPLVARDEVRRWRDWETVLTPMGRYERLALVRTAEPGAFRLRLHSGGEPEP